jgi:hypothetical protein
VLLARTFFNLAALAMLALSACSNLLPQADLKGVAEEARMMTNNANIETRAIEDVHPQGIRIDAV